MSLDSYYQKRNFNKTPEPKGKLSKKNEQLFIIQKHAASHLHYDFRLELDGVLKSWAIPKGPCLDPSVKRLAMHVEDHPVEYGSFEGIIPEGEYGGGTVMLWDKGHWRSLDKDPLQAYHKGHVRFELNAEKLKGKWSLIRFKDDKHWFLVKVNDKYAKPIDDYDITVEQPDSVLSHLSINAIAAAKPATWTKHGLQENRVEKPEVTKSQKNKKTRSKLALPNSPFPKTISPQLATLVDQPPSGDNWLHEVKFDGYRILAFIQGDDIILKSRNNKDWTNKFLPIAQELKKLPVKNAILDGEIVLLNKEGKSNFQLLQNSFTGEKPASFTYYIFDCLYLNNKNLMALPLIERKQHLEKLFEKNYSNLRYSDHILSDGIQVFRKSCDLALEGIISKKIDSPYLEKRSEFWLKSKCIKRQEFVIGGYTKPQGKRDYFGSLLLGVFDEKGALRYCGNVGTGFTEQSLKQIHEELIKNRTNKSPFKVKTPYSGKTTWLKPVLVAEVEFTEWTKDGRLRHPSFQGLRQDKNAKVVHKEVELPVDNITEKIEQNTSATFHISHPEKILYPEDNITKQELLAYYQTVASYMLPYLQNRLLTLVRCPDNYSSCFFQKHFNKSMTKSFKSMLVDNNDQSEKENYFYLTKEEGLFNLVQMGALETHIWGSQINALDYPDMMVFDLDPAPDVPWKKIVAAAFEIRKYLNDYQLKSFVKTTGGKGLHVVVPILPEYTWDRVKQFTQIFVEFLEGLHPKDYITNMGKTKRKGKIFMDYLRNQRGATSICPYSTRAKTHASVATPLDWDELTDNFNDTFYTLRTLPKRLNNLKVDPWQDFWKTEQSLRLDEIV